MTAQRKRVFVACGHIANAEHAHQSFELVGQRHHQAHLVTGQVVTRKAGLVVVFNGFGHITAQAIVAGIVAAHDALQLGEFADHVGQQIGLGQACGLLGLLGQQIAAHLLANRLGDGTNARHALALCAQLVVINHFGQAFNARFERFLAVLVEEELGIGQARAHHTLVAADHQRSVVRRDVAHHQKTVRQLARCVDQGKVFLVGLHREDQAFLRDVQELGLELASQHVRALDQGGHFVQQRVILDRLATTPHLGSRCLQLAHDLGAALGKAGDDRALVPQGLGVLVGVLQDHGRNLGLKAVALGAVASGQAQRFDGHHGGAMQGDQAVRWAHKIDAAPAGQLAIGFQLVLHDFGNRQLGQRFFQRLLQARLQRCAFDNAVVKQGFGFAIRGALERGHSRRRVAHVGPKGLQFFEQRGGGVASRIQAHGHGHELLLHGLVGTLCQHPGHMRGQASGRCKGGHHRVGCGQALGLELFSQHTRESSAEFVERLGRQLFHKQFHQQILCRHVVLPHAAFLGICATHSRGAIGKSKRSRLS